MAFEHSSSESIPSPNDKSFTEHLEAVPTNDNAVRNEKGHLATGEDGLNHEEDAPMTLNLFMSFTAMAFLWTASQIPVYLFGGVPPLIYSELGGADRWIW